VNNNPGGLEFMVTNLTGAGSVQLLSADGVYPTPQQFYSGSFNPGTNVQLISIDTTAAMPSLNGIWYLAVPNPSSSLVPYSITAVTLTNGFSTTPYLHVLSPTNGVISPNNDFVFYWNSQPGESYTVQDSTNLLQWTTLTVPPIKATSTTTYYTNAIPIDADVARYFRLTVP
jgi:hypothetical protein